MKGHSAFPIAPPLQEIHHKIFLSHILDTRWGSLTPLQRCLCILQPQPIGPLVGGVLSLSIDVVCVFCNPNRLGHSLGESYPSAEMSVYFAAPTDWASRWGSLSPLQRCCLCILQPQPIRPLVGGVLPLCRDVICVFCSPNRLCHSLGESYPSAEMLSVYFAAPTN